MLEEIQYSAFLSNIFPTMLKETTFEATSPGGKFEISKITSFTSLALQGLHKSIWKPKENVGPYLIPPHSSCLCWAIFTVVVSVPIKNSFLVPEWLIHISGVLWQIFFLCFFELQSIRKRSAANLWEDLKGWVVSRWSDSFIYSLYWPHFHIRWPQNPSFTYVIYQQLSWKGEKKGSLRVIDVKCLEVLECLMNSSK